MNKQRKLILLVVGIIVLIVGAGFLYNQLSSQMQANTLVVTAPTPEATAVPTPSDAPTDAPEATEAPAAADAPAVTEAPTATAAPTPQPTMPSFTVYDADGNTVQLSDYFGKPIVLNFWASWCGPCRMEMPHFQAAYEEFGDQVHFLMVNMTADRETKQTAMKFLEEEGYTFPVLYDTKQDAAITYGVMSLPTTLFLDAQGHGVAYGRGMLDANALAQGLSMIMK